MRDMTEKQFKAALQRNGLRPAGFMGYVEMTIADGTINGQVISVSKFNAGMNRRTQLAYLLERRDHFQAEADSKSNQPCGL